MNLYLSLIERFSKSIIVVLLSITVFFAFQMTNTSLDSNPYLLPADHPARKPITDMQREFTGTYDAVMIASYNDESVFNRDTLRATYAISHSARKVMLATPEDAATLQSMVERYGGQSKTFADTVAQILDGGLDQNDYFSASRLVVEAQSLDLSRAERAFLEYLPHRLNPIKEMAGLAASGHITTRNGTLNVSKLMESPDVPPEFVRREAMNNDMFLNSVVSPDEKVTLVTIEVAIKQDDADGQLRAYDALTHIVDEYRAKHPEFKDKVFIAGVPIFVAEQKRLVDRDMNTLFPLVIAVVGAILIAFFRRPLGFLLPIMNVVMCTIWTLGMMALFRVPLDMVTSTLPVFLITICGADAIHMMNDFYAEKSTGLSTREAVRQTMRSMLSPIVLTTVTTVAGFLFSTSTNISSIQSFGIFMAIGLVTAQIISLLLIPAWINVFGGKSAAGNLTSAPQDDRFSGGLATIFGAVIRQRKASLVILAALAILSGYLVSNRLLVEDAGSSYFRADNAFRVADEFVNNHIAGTSPGWIRMKHKDGSPMLTLETVRFVDELDAFLRSQPNVTYTYSIATYIKRMYMAMNDMRPAFNRLPDVREVIESNDPDTGKTVAEVVDGDTLVAQLMLMYENGGGNDLTNVLNRNQSGIMTLYTMNTTRASEYRAFLDNLNQWLSLHKPANIEVTLAGNPVIWTGVLDEIIKGQVISFVLAFSAVAAVLMLWLRSFKKGLLTSLPLLATMLFYYGFMALFQIELNIGTALISFVVVGIVDYSVHYLHRIEIGLADGLALDAALLSAIRSSGKSIIFNVLLFSAGFLTLMFSEFKPIVYLGALVALALLISGMMSLLLISLLAPWFLNGDDRQQTQEALATAQ